MDIPRNYLNRVRWQRVFNSTSETVPPYACMEIYGVRPKDVTDLYKDNIGTSYTAAEQDDAANRPAYASHRIGGDNVWNIGKPTERHADADDPTRYIFNGPQPIPKHDYGWGTQDYPCQGLLLRSGNTLVNETCGPVAGKWYLQGSSAVGNYTQTGLSEGAQFRCVGLDSCLAYSDSETYTAWFNRSKQTQGGGFDSGTGLSSSHVPHGGILVPSTIVDWEFIRSRVVYKDGVYLVGMSATISAAGDTAVADGTVLRLRANVCSINSTGGRYDTHQLPFSCHRYHSVDLYSTGLPADVGRENVAMTFPVRLLSKQEVYITNDSQSGVALTVEGFILWMMYVENYPWTNSTQRGRWTDAAQPRS